MMQLAVEGPKLYKLSSQESKSSNSFLEQAYNRTTSSFRVNSSSQNGSPHLLFVAPGRVFI